MPTRLTSQGLAETSTLPSDTQGTRVFTSKPRCPANGLTSSAFWTESLGRHWRLDHVTSLFLVVRVFLCRSPLIIAQPLSLLSRDASAYFKLARACVWHHF